MAITMIMHDVLTETGRKIRSVQPVDQYRKLLDRQKVVYFENEMFLIDYFGLPESATGIISVMSAYDGRKCTVFTF